MKIPMFKTRRLWVRFIFNMGIPILVRRHLYIESTPGSYTLYDNRNIFTVNLNIIGQLYFLPLISSIVIISGTGSGTFENGSLKPKYSKFLANCSNFQVSGAKTTMGSVMQPYLTTARKRMRGIYEFCNSHYTYATRIMGNTKLRLHLMTGAVNKNILLLIRWRY